MPGLVTVPRGPLLVVAPIEPRLTGNGLAMRVGNICRIASELFDVQVAVIPFAGTPPPVGRIDDLDVTVVDAFMGQHSSSNTSPHSLATDVINVIRPVRNSPVLGLRSYLGPTSLAVARQINASWVGMDLDDDDEAFALASGDHDGAVRFNRLLSATVPHFSAVCASSSIDAEAISLRHNVPIATVVNGVEVPKVRPPRSMTSERVLFVGNLTYAPNVEAALVLVNEILPILRRSTSLRSTEVFLVGPFDHHGPIADLATVNGVTVTGFVPTLDPIYRSSSVVVAPIARSSGTRIKILEAFAFGVPVVTTPSGVCGLAARHGEHLLVAETAASLASQTIRLLQSPTLAETLASRAFALVQDRYSLDAQRDQFISLLGRPRLVDEVRCDS